jgi:protein-L-isoaspartate(D-aspartate) O-methyltransferase
MITQPRVEEAMLTVDRANYTDEREGMNPYADKALPIGFNATISAPHMHALGLEFLLPCLTPGTFLLCRSTTRQ